MILLRRKLNFCHNICNAKKFSLDVAGMFLEVEDATGELLRMKQLMKWSFTMSAAQNGIVSHVAKTLKTMACVLVIMSMMIHSLTVRMVSLTAK